MWNLHDAATHALEKQTILTISIAILCLNSICDLFHQNVTFFYYQHPILPRRLSVYMSTYNCLVSSPNFIIFVNTLAPPIGNPGYAFAYTMTKMYISLFRNKILKKTFPQVENLLKRSKNNPQICSKKRNENWKIC